MIIRKAKIEDVEQIHNLGENINEFITSDKIVTFWPKRILKNCIEIDPDAIIVAEENNKIIGFAIANNNKALKKAEIENVFVSPEYRKKGIGTQLLTTLIKNLEIDGCENICFLSREEETKIQELYKKNGFNLGKKFIWMEKTNNQDWKK